MERSECVERRRTWKGWKSSCSLSCRDRRVFEVLTLLFHPGNEITSECSKPSPDYFTLGCPTPDPHTPSLPPPPISPPISARLLLEKERGGRQRRETDREKDGASVKTVEMKARAPKRGAGWKRK